MITRSYCSSWTCSIILRSMRDLRSNPQGAGNPNIPWSCTALLQSSQSAARGTSVYHTHASPSLSKRCERFRRVPCREGGRCCRLLLGENPTHSPNKTHVGSQFRVRNGIDNSSGKKKKKIIPNQTGRVGENNNKKIDIDNDPESPNENAIWISTSRGLR